MEGQGAADTDLDDTEEAVSAEPQHIPAMEGTAAGVTSKGKGKGRGTEIVSMTLATVLPPVVLPLLMAATVDDLIVTDEAGSVQDISTYPAWLLAELHAGLDEGERGAEPVDEID